MAPSVLYTACVLGAMAIYLLLRPGPRALRTVAVLIGLGALAWVARASVAALGTPGEGAPAPFFMLFSLIAIIAAVRMITHHRPVFSALYFVMVVLSSAGLFLLLDAEFMTFALVIVYAGAILITYLFVLMLSQQAPQPGEEAQQPEYDLVPREPAAAVTVGFVLLALLGDTILNHAAGLPPPPAPAQVRTEAWRDLAAMPRELADAARRQVEGFERLADGQPLKVVRGEAFVDVVAAGSPDPRTVRLADAAMPDNLQRLGLSLIRDFPVSLELAGVILLLAMYGAVVLARRQIEMTEDQKRQAAAAGGRP